MRTEVSKSRTLLLTYCNYLCSIFLRFKLYIIFVNYSDSNEGQKFLTEAVKCPTGLDMPVFGFA